MMLPCSDASPIIVNSLLSTKTNTMYKQKMLFAKPLSKKELKQIKGGSGWGNSGCAAVYIFCDFPGTIPGTPCGINNRSSDDCTCQYDHSYGYMLCMP
jgi:bacteriocin-like protein